MSSLDSYHGLSIMGKTSSMSRVLIISGTLNDAAKKKPLVAAMKGTIADAPVDISVEFISGQAEASVKGLVIKSVNTAKADLEKFIKGWKNISLPSSWKSLVRMDLQPW